MRRANFDADQSSLWSDLYTQDHRIKKKKHVWIYWATKTV